MLGMERGRVVLLDHSRNWGAYYLEERERIARISAIKNIEHVGSTTMEDMRAKPVIDIAFQYEDPGAREGIIASFQDLGYDYLGERGVKGRIFFARVLEGQSLYHIGGHLEGDENYDNYLIFRDYLKGHEEARRDYEDLKTQLYKKYPEDRDRYTEGKSDFIRDIVARARKDNL